MSKRVKTKEGDNKQFEPARVVVRFREGIKLRDPNPEKQIEQLGIGPWNKLSQDFPDLKLSPVFREPKQDMINDLVRRAVENDPTYKPVDFSVFYYVDVCLGPTWFPW